MARSGGRWGLDQEGPLRLWQIRLYGFAALPHAFIAMPLTIVVPTFYATSTHVTIAQIALVTTLTRVLDAVADPLIGTLSDKTRSRLGRRKPWVLAGAILCAISILFMFQPRHDATILYYGAWSFLLYLGFSFFEIPRGAWSTELSRDYLTRTRIQSSIAAFNIAGSLVFWTMPLLLSHFTGTFAITGATLTGISWLYGLLMPASILLAAWLVPNGTVPTEALPTVADFFRAVRRNRPLWRHFTVILFWGLGQGAYLSTIFIFVQDYLGQSAIFPLLMILYFVVQIAILPLWIRIIARIGKHRAWAIGMACDVLSRPLILLLGAHGSASTAGLIGLILVGAFFGAPGIIAQGAILGDIVDYDLMKTRVNKAGRFFAFQILLLKATMAIGGGIAFAMLGGTGYQVGKANGAAADRGLIAAYLLLPALCWLAAAAVAWGFPLTASRHAVIRRRLERRAALA